MKFFFVIFYKKVDKVSIEMLYLVNKILLLEQLDNASYRRRISFYSQNVPIITGRCV